MCTLDAEETAARNVLRSARQAGFQRIQVKFPWTQVSASYLRSLGSWIRSEDLAVDALSAYVNCCQPETVLMAARAEHLRRAIDLAIDLRCGILTVWTGGYSSNLAIVDPRNHRPQAEDAVCRFISQFIPAFEEAKLSLALESYITLVCPDAPSLRRLLNRLPVCVGAVLDPPNLTPVHRFFERDIVLQQMFQQLHGRILIAHLKDFKLNPSDDGYVLPGPLDGQMNYSLFLKQLMTLSGSIPFIAEHLSPRQFQQARSRLLAVAHSVGS